MVTYQTKDNRNANYINTNTTAINKETVFVIDPVGDCLISYLGDSSSDEVFPCVYRQIFKKYKTFKSTKNKEFYDILNRVCFSDQIICLDMILTYELFKIKGLEFSESDCLKEIKTLLAEVVKFINDNVTFITNLYSSIDKIIYDKKKYKTTFKLGFFHLDSLIYLSILIKGIHFVSHSSNNEDFLLEDNMVHRNIVMANISNMSMTFNILRKSSLIKTNSIKLMMLLTTYILKKKITVYDKTNWKARLVDKEIKNNNLIQAKLLKKKNFKTNIYLKFNIKTNDSYKGRIFFKIGFKEFKCFEDYLVCDSHLTLCEHTAKSNHQHSKNYINPSAVITLSKKPVYINYQWWPHMVKRLVDDLSIDYHHNKALFEKITTVSGLIEQLERMLVEELRLSSDDGSAKKKAADGNHTIIKSEMYIRINKDIQRIYYMSIAEKLMSVEQPFYTANYYDFRGRIYPDTVTSFMYLKPIRACFECKNYKTDSADLENSIYFKKIIAECVKFHDDIERTIRNNVDRYFFSILFLELGKLNKSKIPSTDGISLQAFIDCGYSLFTHNNSDVFDKDDCVYYLNIQDTINKFLKTSIWENTLIIRDSTASAFQHWGCSIQIKEEHLSRLNLKGSYWYDTYTFIIDLFLKKHPHSLSVKELNGLLTRKLLKQTIMVVNYNAGKTKCLEGFNELLKESSLFKEDHLSIYREFIYKFHDFLKVELFDTLYVGNITNFLEKHSGVFELPDARLHMRYYESIDQQEVIKVGTDRWIFNVKKIQTDVSFEKTKIALNANIVQALDAELARLVINKCNVWAVHDSFAIGMHQTHHLMDTINLFFNQKLTNKHYCLFIVI